METINQRIEMLIKHFSNGKQGEFARKISVAQSNISSVVSGRSASPSYEMIQKIITTYPVNSDWLISGKGAMLKEVEKKEEKPSDSNVLLQMIEILKEELNRYRKREDENKVLLSEIKFLKEFSLGVNNGGGLGKIKSSEPTPEGTYLVTSSATLLAL